MTKIELIEDIAEATGLPQKAVGDVLEALGEMARAKLANAGDKVPLPGIGKLKLAQRPARQGRNPATGETVEIPAERVVKLAVAKELKDAVA
jgi:DNA-binding protein HU-beta